MTDAATYPPKQRPFLLIVGSSRSGTTLMGQLLGEHPDVFIAPETKCFMYVWSQRRLLDGLEPADRIGRIVECLIRSEYPRENPVFPRYRESFARVLAEHRDYGRAFFALIKQLSDRPILGEKTPGHLNFVKPILASAHRPVKVLGMVRAPGAVIASQRGRNLFNHCDDLVFTAERWNADYRGLLRLAGQLGNRTLHIVRFEDLLADPAGVMKGVCDWIGIDLQPQMLVPTFQHSSFRSDRAADGFDLGAIDRWREHLPADQVRLLEAITQPIARRFGYDLPPGQVGLANRLRQLRHRMNLALSRRHAARGLARRGAYHGIPLKPDRD